MTTMGCLLLLATLLCANLRKKVALCDNCRGKRFFVRKEGPDLTKYTPTLMSPARQQFYNNTCECILFYSSVLKLDKDPNTGFDADIDVVESSFTIKCSAAGILFNCDADLVLYESTNSPCSATIDTNPSVTLTGVTGEIQTDRTGQPPVQTADGASNFGGVVSEIPTSEAGQEPVTTSTTDSIAQKQNKQHQDQKHRLTLATKELSLSAPILMAQTDY
ncbi:hypothetical protein BGZ60DRAFT_512818 [Tricladium varicosporioides]|nr:hypothetical protein BGZ60DRAFT_512818 [Hymenoscyphus varicosporioides]